MHKEYFYIHPDHITGNQARLSAEESKHAARVLRKTKGQMIWAVDGRGSAYEIEIIQTKPHIEGTIINRRRRQGEPVHDVTIAQAVLKGDRFEWFIEKAVELGVNRIIPVISENCIASPSAEKTARWRRIAKAAMKQCGRTILPEVTETIPFKKMIALGSNCQFRFIAHYDNKSTPVECPVKKSSSRTFRAMMITGPEGGFSESEIELAIDQGFKPVQLGQRRLRAETAGITIIIQVLTCLGDLS